MNRIRQFRWTVLILAVVAQSGLASDTVKVAWHRDIEDAWRATQQDGRPLLVFVTRSNCVYCTQMKDRTYANPTVAGAINQSFVPLVIDGGANSPLLKELNVTAYPCTFIISPQAVVTDRIDGYVTAEVLTSRLSARRGRVGVAKVEKSR